MSVRRGGLSFVGFVCWLGVASPLSLFWALALFACKRKSERVSYRVAFVGGGCSKKLFVVLVMSGSDDLSVEEKFKKLKAHLSKPISRSTCGIQQCGAHRFTPWTIECETRYGSKNLPKHPEHFYVSPATREKAFLYRDESDKPFYGVMRTFRFVTTTSLEGDQARLLGILRADVESYAQVYPELKYIGYFVTLVGVNNKTFEGSALLDPEMLNVAHPLPESSYTVSVYLTRGFTNRAMVERFGHHWSSLRFPEVNLSRQPGIAPWHYEKLSSRSESWIVETHYELMTVIRSSYKPAKNGELDPTTHYRGGAKLDFTLPHFV